ncbi:MAG: F0F1 ATP synthase subunit C [Alphaproteobacteria bacterium]|nr:F0F1 ATP synthase subunit C [Alphaproteobacteria bacterium]
MEILAVKYIGMGLVALGMMGAAIGAGLIFSGAAQGIARNPSAEGAIRKIAILGVVFAEFMGLLSFVLGIMIMGGK